MLRSLFAAALLLEFSQVPVHAQCAVQPWSIPYLGSNTSTTMSVGSGQPCQIYPSIGGTNVMTGLSVSGPAGNGTASASNDTIVYQSNPGFTGQDSFTFTITGSGPGGSGSSAVQVGVSVQ